MIKNILDEIQANYEPTLKGNNSARLRLKRAVKSLVAACKEADKKGVQEVKYSKTLKNANR